MKARTVFLILFFILPFRIFACGNEYEEGYSYTRADGQQVTTSVYHDSYHFYHGFNEEELTNKRLTLEASIQGQYNYKVQSDYALVLLKLGRTYESLGILKELVRQYPNEYNINANLGTAYELNGDPRQALKYIQRAVEINPLSHNGSEWIHVKILETKIQMDRNPLYLKNTSIIGLYVELDKSYSKKELDSLNKIKEELVWQLTERINFVDAPDPVVANLLSDLGRLVTVTGFIENAIPVYTLSLKYQPLNFDSLIAQRDRLYEKVYWAKVRSYTTNTLIGVAIFGAFVFLIVRWRKRRRRKQKMRMDAEKISNPEPALS
ncbi:MAG: tetratricopeptide repeat protein [Cytophagaceae bacterium]